MSSSANPDDSPVPPLSGDRAGWWVFVVALKSDRTDTFVYGAAAPCSAAPGWTERRTISVADGELDIAEQTVADATFDPFDAGLAQGVIDLTKWLGPGASSLPVQATRRVLQPALGQTAAQVRLYYTLPSVDSLVKDDTGLAEILVVLEKETGLPFASSYAPRLGNFEVFDLHPWLDRPPPVLCELAGSRDLAKDEPQTWEIARTPALAQAAHLAHFVGLVAGDTVIDRLIPLAAGVARVPVVCPEPIDQYAFRLFHADGTTLLHAEDHVFVRQIGFTMSPIFRSVRINDALSMRAAQGGADLVRTAAEVRGKTSQRSLVGPPPKGSWRSFADNLKKRVARTSRPASADRWFPRGITGEVGVIERLNTLMSGAQVRAAVLVDPWFGIDALARLIPRLDSLDLKLTVVTSWSRSDPDTEVAFLPGERAVARLEEALERLRPLIHPALTVINLVDGRDQAFHDRYLLLYPHEGEPQVFLMSNSLNRAAAIWPFVMSQLADDVVAAAQNYIEGLLEDKDRPRDRALTRDFHWSTGAP
jgi:hypothetical protein